ncbi:hypothetical protein ACFS07_17730 [Undibacterium arcticum]
MLPIDAVPRSSSIKDQVRKVGVQIDKAALHNAEDFFSIACRFDFPIHRLSSLDMRCRLMPVTFVRYRQSVMVGARLLSSPRGFEFQTVLPHRLRT